MFCLRNENDFSLKTKEELAKRVAYRCSNPKCRKPTIGPKENNYGTVNIGEAAHICAASTGGARYDKDMTSEERSSVNNGIWLCRNCAALIDRDEKYYTVELLRVWKQLAEIKALAEIEANQNVLNFGNYSEHISLSNNDKKTIEKIINTIEDSNTSYMLKEHDYHGDFQRDYLNSLFELMEYLKRPSSMVNNQQLREKVQVLLDCIEKFRLLIALRGGLAKYGNGSYIIDFEEDQKEANSLCDKIWENYNSLITVYKMYE